MRRNNLLGAGVWFQVLVLSAVLCSAEQSPAGVMVRELNDADVPPALADFTGAQWLWRAGLDDLQALRLKIPPETAYFKYTLGPSVSRSKAVWFSGTADHRLSLYVNGSNIYNSAESRQIHAVEFHSLLTNGANTLYLKVTNDGSLANPGGVVGQILIEHADGSVKQIFTDSQWEASADEVLWEAPLILGAMGTRPWGLLANSRRVMPDHFPAFRVPGYENEMALLRDLFFEHYKFFPYATFWDPWMARSMLWPAADADRIAQNLRVVLSERTMAEEGYIASHQHRGMAHKLGWPFPIWTQIAGWGWHFSGLGNPFAKPAFGVYIHHSLDGWKQDGVSNITYSESRGLQADISPNATLESPAFRVKAISTPFVRFEWWAEGLENATPYLEWTTERQPEFSPGRRICFEPADSMETKTVCMIPLNEVTAEDDVFTGFRIGFGNRRPAGIAIQALMTAADSRHNINNAAWIIACSDYIRLTKDTGFIKEQIERLRRALRYAMTEFKTRENHCINTPWVGHGGRSGVVYEDGKKRIRYGFGVGNNYWDLLPFGGRDFQATLYFYDALLRMSDLEELIRKNPEWGIAEGLNPDELRAHAAEIRTFSQSFFWNPKTGRFVSAVDVDDVGHDYGFTFLNTDAINRGMATPQQARSIMDWISGRRTVDGDTSQGDDIYHWRFGPRSTTLRNTNYYNSVWSNPEAFSFGEQVQDGGAVLGFSYDDLMARLRVYGPDNAWERLKEIIEWYGEVKAEGGVRAYYAKPGRGSLQGGGTAGGLGIDKEFFESVLMPQVMLYGFMGFEPRMDGFALSPRLPTDWPSLQLTDVSFQGGTYDFYAEKGRVSLTMKSGTPRPLAVYLNGRKQIHVKPGSTHQFTDSTASP